MKIDHRTSSSYFRCRWKSCSVYQWRLSTSYHLYSCWCSTSNNRWNRLSKMCWSSSMFGLLYKCSIFLWSNKSDSSFLQSGTFSIVEIFPLKIIFLLDQITKFEISENAPEPISVLQPFQTENHTECQCRCKLTENACPSNTQVWWMIISFSDQIDDNYFRRSITNCVDVENKCVFLNVKRCNVVNF